MSLEIGREVRQVLARPEARRAGRRDNYLFASPRIAADSLLALLYFEHAETAQFDALSACQRLLHRGEHLLHRAFSLDLRDASLAGNSIDDIGLDHPEDRVGGGVTERTAPKLSIPWSPHS